MSKHLTITLLLATTLGSYATPESLQPSGTLPPSETVEPSGTLKPFEPLSPHGLSAALTAGTTGIGIDLSTHINNNIAIRAGFSYLPKIAITKGYKMATVGSTDGVVSEEIQEKRITNLCNYLRGMTGNNDIDEYVDMEHDVKFYNAKLLVDWYPFKNKHWYFTGGFYVGPKKIGKAFNALTESPTVVAINMYNDWYDRARSLGTRDDFTDNLTFTWGGTTYEMDHESTYQMILRFELYGRAAVKLGEFPDGTPHYVTPDGNGTLKADAETNVFKPYLGFGWNTQTGYDKRWTIGINAGALFWGTPHVYCSDGVCLIHDVKNIGGQVGTYIKMLKKFPIYPNLEVRLAYRLFDSK